jgi:hypothetical protein
MLEGLMRAEKGGRGGERERDGGGLEAEEGGGFGRRRKEKLMM